MELVTIQSLGAFKKLMNDGTLISDKNYIDLNKASLIYDWMLEKMNDEIPSSSVEYPLWAWVKYGKIKCPPRHKILGYFANDEDIVVRITFIKDDKDLFITNFKLFSFVLNNQYLPKDKADYEWFLNEMKKRNVTMQDLKAYFRRDKFDSYRIDKEFNELLPIIRKSWDRVISKEGDILQATFWELKVEDIINVEFIHRNQCVPRNYKKAPDNRKEYINNLK